MSTRTQTPAERTAEMRRQLPDGPGVYLFKDKRGRVLYVGKASSIRKRVGSHFSKPATRGAYEMLDQIEAIDFVVTETEAEALLAEQNFIRRHRPRYNIRLRDDKSYPYIGTSLHEDLPRENVENIIRFLSGRYRQIERDLESAMYEASKHEEYELAANLRNRLKAVQSLLERQRISNEAVGTIDVIAVAAEGTDANAQVFQVRDGVLADRQSFYLTNEAGRDEAEVAEEFVLQYYATSPAIPPQVIVPPGLGREREGALGVLLAERRNAPVEVRHAERGDKRRIFELAERNARLALDQDRLRSEKRRTQRILAVEALQKALKMEQLP